VAKMPAGFISLNALKDGPPDPRAALSEIRRIYFETTRQTIEHDLVHAIELLKSLPGEEEREKASVYMEGLNQMRREWDAQSVGKPRKRTRSRQSSQITKRRDR
jgi:phage terminase small subunit